MLSSSSGLPSPAGGIRLNSIDRPASAFDERQLESNRPTTPAIARADINARHWTGPGINYALKIELHSDLQLPPEIGLRRNLAENRVGAVSIRRGKLNAVEDIKSLRPHFQSSPSRKPRGPSLNSDALKLLVPGTHWIRKGYEGRRSA
jgi:hypothetical protein